jgi:Cof subfamily protein (haloacid dehalogenase superfamily)
VNRVALVISDVDGTLVTPDKRLTDASIAAARRLHEKGIGFTVISSRPPMGLRMLIKPLSLDLPIGAFSGGAIVTPKLETMEQHLIPETAARRSVEMLTERGADVWVYTSDRWLVRDPHGAYVAREKRTIEAEPTVVFDFTPYLARAAKIVGSSTDFARLAQCEGAMRPELDEQASVALSQPYYLDVTPPRLDKGTFVEALSRRLAIRPEAIAVLGDMDNDLPMFRKAGMSIAMGNAGAEVKRQADVVTASNTEEGFALAVERYILAEKESPDA